MAISPIHNSCEKKASEIATAECCSACECVLKSLIEQAWHGREVRCRVGDGFFESLRSGAGDARGYRDWFIDEAGGKGWFTGCQGRWRFDLGQGDWGVAHSEWGLGGEVGGVELARRRRRVWELFLQVFASGSGGY